LIPDAKESIEETSAITVEEPKPTTKELLPVAVEEPKPTIEEIKPVAVEEPKPTPVEEEKILEVPLPTGPKSASTNKKKKGKKHH
jgi:hypothetical protein